MRLADIAKGYVVAISSLFAGASVVHYFLRPDLVSGGPLDGCSGCTLFGGRQASHNYLQGLYRRQLASITVCRTRGDFMQRLPVEEVLSASGTSPNTSIPKPA